MVMVMATVMVMGVDIILMKAGKNLLLLTFGHYQNGLLHFLVARKNDF
jgi:hypothetical protein